MKIVLLVILTILTMSLIPKSCGNPSLNPVDPLIVSLHGGLPGRAVTRLKSLQNSGAFRELFWVLLTKTEKFCNIFKKFGSFSGAFWGAFDKYVEILCYFGSFFNVLVSFGSFLGRF